jgi:hypothetical protein
MLDVATIVRLLASDDRKRRLDALYACRDGPARGLAAAVPALLRIARGPRLAGALDEAAHDLERRAAVQALVALDRKGVDIGDAIGALEAIAAERPGGARAVAARFVSDREPPIEVSHREADGLTSTTVHRRPIHGPDAASAMPPPAGDPGTCGRCGGEAACTYVLDESDETLHSVDRELYCARCGLYTVQEYRY